MQLGIMTRTFQRATLEEVADAVCLARLPAVQLNLVSASLDPLPRKLDADTAQRIGDVFQARGLTVSAISANFNSIHPDPDIRRDAIRAFSVVASRSQALGGRILTMCTGTRDPGNMWRKHPENASADAWRDLLETASALVQIADDHGLTVAFEPEVVNVVDNAEKAERLIGEIGSPRLRVLFDPANLIRPVDLPDTERRLREDLARLAPYIAIAHAKDVARPLTGSTECHRVTASQGLLDYSTYLRGLATCGFDGALIMHDLAETEIEACRLMLQSLAPAGVL
jgi:sugar phosphate isomerase/epimerase